MREIKYQLVWQGAIYDPLDMLQITGGQWEIDGKMYEDNERNGNKKGDYVSIPRKDYVFFSEDENDFGIWRQYTGLKDKNGKEIYEGDIVKYNYHHIEGFGERIGEIIWSELEHGFYNAEPKLYTHLSIMVRDSKVYEVIGNIYENPELLTK